MFIFWQISQSSTCLLVLPWLKKNNNYISELKCQSKAFKTNIKYFHLFFVACIINS